MKIILICLICVLGFAVCSDNDQGLSTEFYPSEVQDPSQSEAHLFRDKPYAGVPDVNQSAPVGTGSRCPPVGKPHLKHRIGDRCFCPPDYHQFYGDRCCKLCNGGQRIAARSCQCVPFNENGL